MWVWWLGVTDAEGQRDDRRDGQGHGESQRSQLKGVAPNTLERMTQRWLVKQVAGLYGWCHG